MVFRWLPGRKKRPVTTTIIARSKDAWISAVHTGLEPGSHLVLQSPFDDTVLGTAVADDNGTAVIRNEAAPATPEASELRSGAKPGYTIVYREPVVPSPTKVATPASKPIRPSKATRARRRLKKKAARE